MSTHQKINAEFARRCPWGPSVEGWSDAARRAGKDPAATKAFKAFQAQHSADCAAFAKELDAKIDALLPKITGQARALLGDRPKLGAGIFEQRTKADKGFCNALQVFAHNCERAIAAGPAPVTPKAPSPKPAPAPAAAKPAPALTAESIGRAVVQTVTHPDPAIRVPAQKALATISRSAEEARERTMKAWSRK